MLSHLYISNYAIIDELDIAFQEGFTTLTGETGAGKSILLGALGLILGERADTSVLNTKDKKCVVEGSFSISKDEYSTFFADNDLDFESTTIVRREIASSGKSRAFINDTPVTLSVIKSFSTRLIDIHSQHQSLFIGESNFQVNVVDGFAGITEEVNIYKKEYKQYKTILKELELLQQQESKANADKDYIQFQLNEIEELSLIQDEQELLEEEVEKLSNVEEIKNALGASYHHLHEADESILTRLKQISNSLNGISSYSEKYKELNDRVSSVSIELDDLSSELGNLSEELTINPQQLLEQQERLSRIYQLEKKHQLSNSNELITLKEDLEKELGLIASANDRVEVLKEEILKTEEQLKEQANDISKKRGESKSLLEQKVLKSLIPLGMKEASFVVDLSKTDFLTENGLDNIIFKFSGNKGFETQPLNKVASGGELSRLMLVVKEILGESYKLSTLIFDEIDTGVSGDIADKIGGMMKNMAKNTQILAITHLPQVAAKGNQHYKIYKEVVSDKTKTNLRALTDHERVEELAKMLSGKDLTKAAIENAQNLIAN